MAKATSRKLLVSLLTLLATFLLTISLVQGADFANDVGPQPEIKPVEYDIEWRQSIGFLSDTAYVESVRASEEAVIKDDLGNVALTPEEANELEIRIDLENDMITLLEFFEQKLEFQEAFGGIYIEHAAGSEDYTTGGQLVLQLVRDHPQVDDIPDLLPLLQYPERLHIELVDYPDAHLKQQFQTISNALSQHPELRAVSIDQPNNRIEVMIVPSDMWVVSDGLVDKTSLPDELTALLADSSVIIVEGEIEEQVTSVRGGQSWSDTSGGSDCTLGFKVMHGTWYTMLTAGHCLDTLSPGAYIYHNTTLLGVYSGLFLDGAETSSEAGLDAGLLYMLDRWTAQDDVIADYAPLGYRDITGPTSNYQTGIWRCWRGKNSASNCGTMNCTHKTYLSGFNGLYYTDMFSIDPPPVLGDSGAPAYQAHSGDKARVTGILRGSASLSCGNGSDAVFTKWDHIRNAFGVTLVNNG